MTEELFPRIHRIQVPLPDTPLKMTNAWLIKAHRKGARHLLIDNGFNRPESLAGLMAGLESLDIRLEDLDCFITHAHADHNGLTPALRASPEAKAWCQADDARAINTSVTSDAYWKKLFARMAENGFPHEELHAIAARHPARIYAMAAPVDFDLVAEGDILEYSGYALTVIDVPGHTPGHVVLHEAQEKILFSGDHILGSVTPNISPWLSMEDPLQSYLQSLDKIAQLDIRLTLPGHRRLIRNTSQRIAELKEHHARRLEEVRSILRGQCLTAYQTASRMSWSLRYSCWEDFPAPQKWFATGEALAHIRHLLNKGETSLNEAHSRSVFTLAEN